MTEPHHEIERRWLLRKPPPERIQPFPKITIVQGYALCQPGELIVQKRTPEDYELALNMLLSDTAQRATFANRVPLWIYKHYQDRQNQGKVRIREINGKEWVITIKGDGTLARPEWEVAVPEHVARILFERSLPRVIHKTRIKVPEGNHTLEFDIYTHRPDLAGLILLESEFESESIARAFTLPSWVGPAREVTEDKRFSGGSLARRGIPFDPF